MENATKALIIAAAVLVTILVIALGVGIVKKGDAEAYPFFYLIAFLFVLRLYMNDLIKNKFYKDFTHVCMWILLSGNIICVYSRESTETNVKGDIK